MIYAAQIGPYVKIGSSCDIARRMRSLPAGAVRPDDVSAGASVILAGWCEGDVRDERALHHRFAEWRLRGEYFTFSEPLREWIATLRRDEPPVVLTGRRVRRRILMTRVSADGLAYIDALADEMHADRASVMRAMLAVALIYPAEIRERLERHAP